MDVAEWGPPDHADISLSSTHETDQGNRPRDAGELLVLGDCHRYIQHVDRCLWTYCDAFCLTIETDTTSVAANRSPVTAI